MSVFSLPTFSPSAPLLPGRAHQGCCACVAIPARNEEVTLPRCLDALADQVDLTGAPLPAASYEVLLLLNNCTDHSAAVVQRWCASHPGISVHSVERTFCAEQAHVGTARRLLMDTAWHRLAGAASGRAAILSTDADTVVARDWIAQNLAALDAGADLVGGAVHVLAKDLLALPDAVQRCYEQDRCYASLVAQLEDALDPQPTDPWPRHLDHFGSSLACTPEAYARAGGMPAVNRLEDEAFVDRARGANLRLRHEPAVRVATSARLKGRAPVGMAGQLQNWAALPHADAHDVRSAAYLEHRFRTLHRLRQIFNAKDPGDLPLRTQWWKDTFAEALQTKPTCPEFLGAIYCDILIEESFAGAHREPIESAIAGLRTRLMVPPGSCGTTQQSAPGQLKK